MTSESRVLNSIVRYLTRLKQEGRAVWWTKLRAGPWQRAGLPDLLIVYQGTAIFCEVKAPGGTATKLQREMLARIKAAGAIADVVSSAGQVAAIIEGLIVRAF